MKRLIAALLLVLPVAANAAGLSGMWTNIADIAVNGDKVYVWINAKNTAYCIAYDIHELVNEVQAQQAVTQAAKVPLFNVLSSMYLKMEMNANPLSLEDTAICTGQSVANLPPPLPKLTGWVVAKNGTTTTRPVYKLVNGIPTSTPVRADVLTVQCTGDKIPNTSSDIRHQWMHYAASPDANNQVDNYIVYCEFVQ